jgi:hypothetical protein
MDARRMSAQPRQLRVVSSEIVRTARLMDARNRQRFAEDGQLLGSLDQCEYGAGHSAARDGAGRGDGRRQRGEGGSVRRGGSGGMVDV